MIDVAALFPGAAEISYLNTASMALGNRPGSVALSTAIDQWVNGTFDWVRAEAAGEELRSVVAGVLAVDRDDLAFVAGASGGASTVAAQLPDGSSGANVVVPARDFASNFLPWKLLTNRGYEVRLVDDDQGVLEIDAFADLVDSNTAVVATSLVQSATGYRVDLDDLKSLTQDAEAWLVVDASQALGSIEIDIDGVHALFSCSHKWLCGVRGMAHLYVHPDLRDRFRPISPGWKATVRPMQSFYGPSLKLATTASKLDVSTPWFDPIVNLEGARIVADVGIRAIEAHNRALIDKLESEGVAVPFDAPNRSQIVSIEIADTARVLDRLREEDIVASARAGRLRVSVHFYNTEYDIEKLVAALR